MLGNIGGLADAVLSIGVIINAYFAAELATVKAVRLYQHLQETVWNVKRDVHFDDCFSFKLFITSKFCCCFRPRKIFGSDFEDMLDRLKVLDSQISEQLTLKKIMSLRRPMNRVAVKRA